MVAEFEEQLEQAKKVQAYAKHIKYFIVKGQPRGIRAMAKFLKEELNKLLGMIEEE